MGRILHLMPSDKFIPPFIQFIRQHFAYQEHLFCTVGDIGTYPYLAGPDTTYLGHSLAMRDIRTVRSAIADADRVIIHSLFFCRNMLGALATLPSLTLQKCIWAAWGGDLYSPEWLKRFYPISVHQPAERPPIRARIGTALRASFRRRIIRHVGGIITTLKGDYDLAVSLYGARGGHYSTLLYPSNLFSPLPTIAPSPDRADQVVILAGNSADPTNLHREIIDRIGSDAGPNVQVICPLSYAGPPDYVRSVVGYGRQRLGHRFKPLLSILPWPQYRDILATVDIAIFAHPRSQAYGNIISLLGMGKAVYLRREVPSYAHLKGIGVAIGDLADLSFARLDPETVRRNIAIISREFSERALITTLSTLFQDSFSTTQEQAHAEAS